METWTNEFSTSFREVNKDRVVVRMPGHDHYAEFVSGGAGFLNLLAGSGAYDRLAITAFKLFGRIGPFPFEDA